jgi:hypothetical protein
MDSVKKFYGYFWFSYFTVGKESLLAHGFKTIRQ